MLRVYWTMNGVSLEVLKSSRTDSNHSLRPLVPISILPSLQNLPTYFFLPPKSFFFSRTSTSSTTSQHLSCASGFLSPFRLRVLARCRCLFGFRSRLAASALSAFLRPASSCLVSRCITRSQLNHLESVAENSSATLAAAGNPTLGQGPSTIAATRRAQRPRNIPATGRPEAPDLVSTRQLSWGRIRLRPWISISCRLHPPVGADSVERVTIHHGMKKEANTAVIQISECESYLPINPSPFAISHRLPSLISVT